MVCDMIMHIHVIVCGMMMCGGVCRLLQGVVTVGMCAHPHMVTAQAFKAPYKGAPEAAFWITLSFD